MNLRVVVLFAALGASSAFAAGSQVSIESSHRKATLLQGQSLDGSYIPSEAPPMRLLDGLRFSFQDHFPLDTGGGSGVSNDLRPILALVLGLLIGFGLGHLVARDRNGFVLFLIVDLVIILLGGGLGLVPGIGLLGGGLAGLALLVSHIIQGIDAFEKAGGGRIVEWTREHSVEVASVREEVPVTFRLLGLAF
jgi:hypothetical protein